MSEPTAKQVDEIVDILMQTEESKDHFIGTKCPNPNSVAEELKVWLYEHLQENGLENTVASYKAWHKIEIEQYWVESAMEFGHQIYSVHTLTNQEPRTWSLVVKNRWADHIEGSWSKERILEEQTKLSNYTTIEDVTKKLLEIAADNIWYHASPILFEHFEIGKQSNSRVPFKDSIALTKNIDLAKVFAKGNGYLYSVKFTPKLNLDMPSKFYYMPVLDNDSEGSKCLRVYDTTELVIMSTERVQ